MQGEKAQVAGDRLLNSPFKMPCIACKTEGEFDIRSRVNYSKIFSPAPLQ